MEAKKTKLRIRHDKAYKELCKAVEGKLEKNSTATYQLVGSKIGVVGETIRNYVKGVCRDGFMTESITEEFKKLK